MGFITRRTDLLFTKRWRHSSTSICIRSRRKTHKERNRTPTKGHGRSGERRFQALFQLGFDRWVDVFCFPDVEAAAQFAVPHAVKKINDQADHEPDDKPNPG